MNMREIIFRGKRTTDGEWCEGNLFVDERGDKHEILLGYTNYRIAWEVIPETVGQYTGLTDKNGKKIFEGDIICLGGKYTYTVEYSTENGAFLLMCEIDPQMPFNNTSLGEWRREAFEIVGNIHDNPELLKGGVDK